MELPPFDRVCVIGLGKLGLPWACILASKGIEVVGIDAASQIVRMINSAAYDGAEPNVAELLSQYTQRIKATNLYDAIEGTQAAFIVVPTPSDARHRFTLDYVLPAVEQISGVVTRADMHDYVIVLVSTVMPLSCQQFIFPAIERASGQRRGQGIHLGYCPEFVALGRVVHDMLRPDLVLIGASDSAVAHHLANFYARIVENEPSVVAMSLTSAEVAKLGINAMVSFKIACANLLGCLCHELPGASVDDVERAVGSDSRIGRKFLRSGLGFGGPCLPRDVRALASLCQELDIDTCIPDAVSSFNASTPETIVQIVERQTAPGASVGVLGLAYRPKTAITAESQACHVVRELRKAGYKVFAHDPLVRVAECPELASLDIHECKDVPTLSAQCQTMVIATTAEEYRSISPSLLDGHVVVDCWRHLCSETIETCLSRPRSGGFRYVPFGIGGDSAATLSRSAELRMLLHQPEASARGLKCSAKD